VVVRATLNSDNFFSDFLDLDEATIDQRVAEDSFYLVDVPGLSLPLQMQTINFAQGYQSPLVRIKRAMNVEQSGQGEPCSSNTGCLTGPSHVLSVSVRANGIL